MVSTTPVNFAPDTAGVVHTGGKFATGVNEIPRKFAASVNNTGDKLSPVSTTPLSTNRINIRLPTPYSELQGKKYLNNNSNTQRCPNKITEIFLIENFILEL